MHWSFQPGKHVNGVSLCSNSIEFRLSNQQSFLMCILKHLECQTAPTRSGVGKSKKIKMFVANFEKSNPWKKKQDRCVPYRWTGRITTRKPKPWSQIPFCPNHFRLQLMQNLTVSFLFFSAGPQITYPFTRTPPARGTALRTNTSAGRTPRIAAGYSPRLSVAAPPSLPLVCPHPHVANFQAAPAL